MKLDINLNSWGTSLDANVEDLGYDLSNSTFHLGTLTLGHLYIIIYRDRQPGQGLKGDTSAKASPVPEVVKVSVCDYIIDILSEDVSCVFYLTSFELSLITCPSASSAAHKSFASGTASPSTSDAPASSRSASWTTSPS